MVKTRIATSHKLLIFWKMNIRNIKNSAYFDEICKSLNYVGVCHHRTSSTSKHRARGFNSCWSLVLGILHLENIHWPFLVWIFEHRILRRTHCLRALRQITCPYWLIDDSVLSSDRWTWNQQTLSKPTPSKDSYAMKLLLCNNCVNGFMVTLGNPGKAWPNLRFLIDEKVAYYWVPMQNLLKTYILIFRYNFIHVMIKYFWFVQCAMLLCWLTLMEDIELCHLMMM